LRTSGERYFDDVEEFLESIRKTSPPRGLRLHLHSEPENFSPMRISTSHGVRNYDVFQDPNADLRPKTTIHTSRKSRMAFVSAFEYNNKESYSIPSWVTPRKIKTAQPASRPRTIVSRRILLHSLVVDYLQFSPLLTRKAKSPWKSSPYKVSSPREGLRHERISRVGSMVPSLSTRNSRRNLWNRCRVNQLRMNCVKL